MIVHFAYRLYPSGKHTMNRIRLRVTRSNVPQIIGKLGQGAVVRHLGEMPPRLGLDTAEHIGRSATPIFTIPNGLPVPAAWLWLPHPPAATILSRRRAPMERASESRTGTYGFAFRHARIGTTQARIRRSDASSCSQASGAPFAELSRASAIRIAIAVTRPTMVASTG